jgi:NAD(P)-dependent dehydrogenase (short-subunit alcohol dehydrogenase family)
MCGKLEGKMALVTGGSSGIGRAAALAFAREGADLVIADIQTEPGEETVQMIENTGRKAIFVKTDVSKATEVEMLISTAVETYGRLDCAHNNAGIEGTMATTANYTEDDWDRIMTINLKGTWLCMKYEILQMLKQGGGTIVNTASTNGMTGFPGMPAYCASKGGILQLTRTAALEYARAGIRVNAVCPGTIQTPMLERIATNISNAGTPFALNLPSGRIGTPEEAAAAVVWLCSDAASFVTGHALVVDGGMTAQ